MQKITQAILDKMAQTHDTLQGLSIDEVQALVDRGQKIEDTYGSENLSNVLKLEDDMKAHSALCIYLLVTDEDL
jgi:hypothetical protein